MTSTSASPCLRAHAVFRTRPRMKAIQADLWYQMRPCAEKRASGVSGRPRLSAVSESA
jgi:hypothetical protein